MAKWYRYEVNGSVYFDVVKYNKTNNYGKLSGRVLEDLISGAGEERRELEGEMKSTTVLILHFGRKHRKSHARREVGKSRGVLVSLDGTLNVLL